MVCADGVTKMYTLRHNYRYPSIVLTFVELQILSINPNKSDRGVTDYVS